MIVQVYVYESVFISKILKHYHILFIRLLSSRAAVGTDRTEVQKAPKLCRIHQKSVPQLHSGNFTTSMRIKTTFLTIDRNSQIIYNFISDCGISLPIYWCTLVRCQVLKNKYFKSPLLSIFNTYIIIEAYEK